MVFIGRAQAVDRLAFGVAKHIDEAGVNEALEIAVHGGEPHFRAEIPKVFV